MHLRRRLVLLVAAALVAGCGALGGAPEEAQGSAPPPTAPRAGDPGDDPTTSPPPEDVERFEEPPRDAPEALRIPEVPAGYELIADETGPASKRAAVALAEGLTTYDPGDRLEDVVARVTSDPDLIAELIEVAAPLHHEGAWSRGQVVYPQLGGLEPHATAVITVVRQQVGLPDGTTFEHTRTLDVRVDRGPDGEWRTSALVSAGGHPVPRPDDLHPAAVAVLDDDRIELPDTARWDIHAGLIDPSLLELMARMAERTPYGVVVLQTGHSLEVFGTDRTSRHAEGRAVDLYRVGDHHVISDRDRGSDTFRLVDWLYDQPELAEVGSPWALDGFGGRSFSDELHQDHIHVGVRRPGERAKPLTRG